MIFINVDLPAPFSPTTALCVPGPIAKDILFSISLLPYDFDYAGLVGTEYAIPFETLPIETTKDRLYMAVCRSETEFINELKEFVDKKDQFYKVINDFPYLSARSKKDMINYLEGFFSGIDKRNTMVNKLLKDCSWFEEQANLKIR